MYKGHMHPIYSVEEIGLQHYNLLQLTRSHPPPAHFSPFFLGTVFENVSDVSSVDSSAVENADRSVPQRLGEASSRVAMVSLMLITIGSAILKLVAEWDPVFFLETMTGTRMTPRGSLALWAR